MKKFSCLLMFLLTVCADIIAQDIGVSLGYGAYSMSDLKILNFGEIITAPNNVELKTEDNFPAYLTLAASISFQLGDRFKLGGSGSLFSTGSRLAYSDYSGHMFFDQKLHGISVGVVPMFILAGGSRDAFSVEVRNGFTLSYLTITSELQIMDETSTYSRYFNSMNYFIEPALRYTHQIGDSRVDIGLRGGFYFSLVKGNFVNKQDPDEYLVTPAGDAHADWSGWRADFLVLYRLGD